MQQQRKQWIGTNRSWHLPVDVQMVVSAVLQCMCLQVVTVMFDKEATWTGVDERVTQTTWTLHCLRRSIWCPYAGKGKHWKHIHDVCLYQMFMFQHVIFWLPEILFMLYTSSSIMLIYDLTISSLDIQSACTLTTQVPQTLYSTYLMSGDQWQVNFNKLPHCFYASQQ